MCLQGLTACDSNGVIGTTSLPKYIKSLGPYTSDATTIQSLATALHVSSQPITGNCYLHQIMWRKVVIGLERDVNIVYLQVTPFIILFIICTSN